MSKIFNNITMHFSKYLFTSLNIISPFNNMEIKGV